MRLTFKINAGVGEEPKQRSFLEFLSDISLTPFSPLDPPLKNDFVFAPLYSDVFRKCWSNHFFLITIIMSIFLNPNMSIVGDHSFFPSPACSPPGGASRVMFIVLSGMSSDPFIFALTTRCPSFVINDSMLSTSTFWKIKPSTKPWRKQSLLLLNLLIVYQWLYTLYN